MSLLLLQVAGANDPAGVIGLCVALTLVTLVYMFYLRGEVAGAEVKTRLAYLYERKDVVYENLRDLNFEHRAGKVPDKDFLELRTSLEDEAAALLVEIDDLESKGVRS